MIEESINCIDCGDFAAKVSKTFSQNWKWSHLISQACNTEQKERFLRPFVADHRFLLGKGITAASLGRLLKARGVGHIIYCGWALNWCLWFSPCGMCDMDRKGYMCSAVRGGCVAIENRDSAAGERNLEYAYWKTSTMFGYIFGGAIAGGVSKYLPLLIPGILAQTVAAYDIFEAPYLFDDEKHFSKVIRSPIRIDLSDRLIKAAGIRTPALGFYAQENPQVADYFIESHPVVMRLLKIVVDSAKPMPVGGGKFIQPTGKAFKMPMCTVGHWKNGVMDEESLFWDNATYMRQIGLSQ